MGEEDQPVGYDPTKDKFSQTWCRKFMRRKGFSMRKAANKKKKTIWQRMHKIQNFHHFAIYRLPNLDISSEEETSSEDAVTIMKKRLMTQKLLLKKNPRVKRPPVKNVSHDFK